MKWYALIVSLLLFACDHKDRSSPDLAKQQEDDTSVEKQSDTSYTPSIKIGKINLEQTGIEGCSGLFRDSSQTFSDLEYSFATDLQHKAFIVVNGMNIELSKSNSSNSEDAIYEEYVNERYRVILNVKEVKRLGDEVWQYKGTIIIENGVSKNELSVIGEIGC